MDQAEVYKKRIRHEVMKVSVSLMAFYAVYFAIAIIFTIIFIVAGGYFSDLLGESTAANGTVAPNTDDIMASIPLGFLSILALFAGSFMMLIVRGKKLYTTDLTKTSSRIHVPDFFKMAGIMLGINAAITLVSYLFTLFLEKQGYTPGADVFEMYFKNLPGLLYVVILGPILEEIIFRGAILRSLERFGQNFAIVVSSILFGLYHLALFQGFFAFFIGLIFAYCTIRFSIKWAMLLHMINNGFAMSFMYMPDSAFVNLAILLVMLVLGVIAVFFGFKTFKEQIRNGKPTELHFAAGVPIVPYYLSPADSRVAPYIAPAMMLKAKPYHMAFSSAWLIVALSLATLFTLLMTFSL